jgi:hypothetical protein
MGVFDAETVSRPKKLNHVETILYEMDMLDYCFSRLRERKGTDADYNLCIEGFLLHYRNLIQFFGNHTGLRAGEPREWSIQRTLSDAEVATIQNASLLKEYDGPISIYLCHCTPNRAERDIEWRYIEMHERIAPLLGNFRWLFPPQLRARRELFLTDSASTTTMTTYAAFIEDSSGAIHRKTDT